ncbi:Txe/YoeB family addiction module toxin [Leisingera caerulea]|uniref:Txe/YoeB family addiction module toxin n=1 Tax=Leisingera caerulea TaxID=506591 RepID=UPI003F4AAF03
MKLTFSNDAWEDYEYWQGADKKILKRINDLIKETMRDPNGRGAKAERLKGHLSGWCSKRINKEHRMVYRIRGSDADQTLEIAALRYHY